MTFRDFPQIRYFSILPIEAWNRQYGPLHVLWFRWPWKTHFLTKSRKAIEYKSILSPLPHLQSICNPPPTLHRGHSAWGTSELTVKFNFPFQSSTYLNFFRQLKRQPPFSSSKVFLPFFITLHSPISLILAIIHRSLRTPPFLSAHPSPHNAGKTQVLTFVLFVLTSWMISPNPAVSITLFIQVHTKPDHAPEQ